MDQGEAGKLERYFRNADHFMWGVVPGDKRTVFTALRAIVVELGEDGALVPDEKKATYDMVAQNLIAKLGIERVLTQVVVKQVRRQFAHRTGALEFLRVHWVSGTLPRWQTLQSLRAPRSVKQRLRDAMDSKDTPQKRRQTSDILDAFVEVNTQYEYVHGWTAFAGLWFEEIEPLLKETGAPYEG